MMTAVSRSVAQVLGLDDHFASASAEQTFELCLSGFALPEMQHARRKG